MNKILGKIVLVLALVTLSGCAATTALSALSTITGSKPGLSVDAQVGKENTKQIVGTQEKQEISAAENSQVSVEKSDSNSGISSKSTGSAKSSTVKKLIGNERSTDTSVKADTVSQVKSGGAISDVSVGANSHVTINNNKGLSVWWLLLFPLGLLLVFWPKIRDKYRGYF